jgi:GT2 family glycosyltransferase
MRNARLVLSKEHAPATGPAASVVIITRNRAHVLRECLAHVSEQSFTDYEIVVVDSSSNDETTELLRHWSDVRCVRMVGGRNNMPAARNAGIAQARGDVVAFIDDDSLVSERWLGNLLDGYEAPDVGAVGGRVDDPLLLTHGERRVGSINLDGSLVRNFAKPDAGTRDVDWLNGCNMSFARSALAATGGFDEAFTGDNSFEEVDHAVRVRAKGYRLRFVPEASVVHLAVRRGAGDVQRDHLSARTRYYKARNETYFCLKTFGLDRAVISRLQSEMRGLVLHTVRNLSWRLLLLIPAIALGRVAGVCAWIRWTSRPGIPLDRGLA